MSESEIRPLGKDGDLCAQCGSPLAADQRYCLECGKRRGGPRVDYRQRMLAAASAGPDRPAPDPAATPLPDGSEPARSAKGERDFAPLAAVGGIAVLGLMLLVGVLIGRGDGDSAPAPAPVVVQGGAGANAAGSGDTAGGGEGSGGSALGGGSSGGKSKNKNAKGGGETAAEAGAVTASKDDLAELESETGEDAAKNALKLPDKIATPGAPPPIDKSKPPGGGEGGGLVIK